ncbi:acetyltransferase [Chitinophaga nivalis]|uniref:Acetyltransferase n=1 Tax=Chitinophaga nivalis TaxID=2991709 RepID=A0ABT3IKQ9_9BACT|nr:acetyltransferase [Chitinophaga nivalis]MCW3465757.1 acetyltransferase [Chitinophaga nivalis]MCW3484552.1 acetyltransferase [Chitinophaga nivalis]
MNICQVNKADYPQLLQVWEASVRATHDFLTETDIQYFKPLILNTYFDAVSLCCTKDETGQITGFMGTADNKVEMLFIHPDTRGKGVGKALLRHGITQLHITEVDVNEQNEQAVGFYRHMGFQVVHRSPVDGMGKPFPILSMVLQPA